MSQHPSGELVDGTSGVPADRAADRRRVRWMCAQVTGDPVLDIGCGHGVASIQLGREGWRVVGVDRETGAVDAARERLQTEPEPVRSRVRFELAEAADLPFDAESFEAVLLGAVLEHQVAPDQLIAAADRVLAPGACAVVTVPYGVSRAHDPKAPIYLGPLLELLADRWEATRLALIDGYVGVALRKPETGAQPADVSWRAALALADERVAAHDLTIDQQDRRLKRLRSEKDALLAEREEQLRLRADLDAARERAAAAERQLTDLRDTERHVRSALEVAELALARAQAERDEAQRLTEALRDV